MGLFNASGPAPPTMASPFAVGEPAAFFVSLQPGWQSFPLGLRTNHIRSGLACTEFLHLLDDVNLSKGVTVRPSNTSAVMRELSCLTKKFKGLLASRAQMTAIVAYLYLAFLGMQLQVPSENIFGSESSAIIPPLRKPGEHTFTFKVDTTLPSRH